MPDRTRKELQAEVNGLFTGRTRAEYDAMKRAYELGIEARSRVSGTASAEDGDGPITLPPAPGQSAGPG